MENDLFGKYQSQLCRLANHPLGRKFLGISHEVKDKIIGISDNAYFIQKGRNKYQATFRCYPVFAKRLHYALTAVDIAKDWLVRNKEIYRPLPDYVGLLNYAGILRDNRFPNIMLASPETIFSGAGDGVTNKRTGAWATSRTNPAGTADYTSAQVYTDCLYSGTYDLSRLFTPFDCSVIPSDSKITAGVHYLMAQNVIANNGKWNLRATTQASPTAVVVNDHANVGTVRFVDTDITIAAAGNYNTFTMNAAGVAAIVAGGWTQIGGCVDRDIDNTAPPTSPQYNNIAMCMSETAGTTSDPKLVVTFTLPSGGGNPMFFNGSLALG